MANFAAIFSGKQIDLEADSLYSAKLKAIELLKVPKSKQGLLSVKFVSDSSPLKREPVVDFYSNDKIKTGTRLARPYESIKSFKQFVCEEEKEEIECYSCGNEFEYDPYKDVHDLPTIDNGQYKEIHSVTCPECGSTNEV